MHHTEDGGKTWEAIDLPSLSEDEEFHCAVSPDGTVFYLNNAEEDTPGYSNCRVKTLLIRRIPTANGRWDKETDELPLSLVGSGIHIDGGVVWIVVRDAATYWKGPDRLARWDGPGNLTVLAHPSFEYVDAISSVGPTITMAFWSPTLPAMEFPQHC